MKKYYFLLFYLIFFVFFNNNIFCLFKNFAFFIKFLLSIKFYFGSLPFFPISQLFVYGKTQTIADGLLHLPISKVHFVKQASCHAEPSPKSTQLLFQISSNNLGKLIQLFNIGKFLAIDSLLCRQVFLLPSKNTQHRNPF